MKMKKYILIIPIILAFCAGPVFPVFAQEEISTEYERLTKDYEEKDIGEIVVNQKTISSLDMTWTLNEIDMYIKMNQVQIDKFKDNINDLKEIRYKVESEAKKVKLYKGQEGT